MLDREHRIEAVGLGIHRTAGRVLLCACSAERRADGAWRDGLVVPGLVHGGAVFVDGAHEQVQVLLELAAVGGD